MKISKRRLTLIIKEEILSLLGEVDQYNIHRAYQQHRNPDAEGPLTAELEDLSALKQSDPQAYEQQLAALLEMPDFAEWFQAKSVGDPLPPELVADINAIVAPEE